MKKAVRNGGFAIRKRAIAVDGRRTSVSLEKEFWESFKTIAAEREVTINALASQVRRTCGQTNLSSAIRLFVLDYYRALSTLE